MMSLLPLLGPQAKASLLANGSFDDGLKGWQVEGEARVVDGALVLGPGKGAVRQRYGVPGLRILYFGASVKPSGPRVMANVRVQCYDSRGRLVMNLAAAPDAKAYPAIYLKTQANTASVVLSIEKTNDVGTVVADDGRLQDDDRNRVEHPPQMDLDAAMRPLWKGRRVSDESVLLLAKVKGRAQGRLMFRPTKLLSVKDSSLRTTYVEGKDYRLQGDRIVAMEGSSIPTMDEGEFAKGRFPWTRLDGRHVFATYDHRDVWKGPVPAYQGDRLPETVRLLKVKHPVEIVAFGDSITQGVNVSGFRNVPPYLPPWPSIFARELGRRFGNRRVEMINASLGGQTSYWAKDNARDAVAALNPDLVLLGFGMNDFWSLTPKEFRANVASTMATIRARRPKCEFILVASMRFDPDYTKDPTYIGHFDGYAEALRKMAGPGVAVFDMTALSGSLYRAKGAKGLMADPMHPDDFLSRWYAQGMVATLVRL